MKTVLSAAFCIFIQASLAIAQQCTNQDCAYSGPAAPPMGALVLPEFPVLFINVYGQKDDWGDADCEARLRRTGEIVADTVPNYVIVGMTEVHPDYARITCDGRAVVEGMQKNGEYGSGKHRWGHPETDWTSYDGGLAIFSTAMFDWEPYDRHAHKYDFDPWFRTPHGFVFAQIMVSPQVTIDVYVTHLHSQSSWPVECDRGCRYQELEELAKGIHERSQSSGNPVLVMGDFNIGGPNPSPGVCDGNCGYSDIMDVLRNPRDLWSETRPQGPGSTHGVDLPTTVGERIDFMFVMTDPFFYDSPFEIFLAGRERVSIMAWEMPDGTPVSDHFGLRALLEVREARDPPDCPTPPPGSDQCAPGRGVIVQ